MRFSLTLLFSLLLSCLAFPAVIKVPQDYATIQQGLEVAANGDTVEVSPGLYPENLHLNGKEIILLSTGGPEVTTIDGNSTGSVLTFSLGLGLNTRVEGFTLTNGAAEVGGAVLCSDTTVSFINNRFVDNTAMFYGGGIYCWESEISLEDNRVEDNQAFNGAGLYASLSVLTLNNNVFSGNVATGLGGGVSADNDSDLAFTDNRFEDNQSFSGAGVYLSLSPATFLRNTFEGNMAQYNGGGVFSYNQSDSLFQENSFLDNTGFHGGGICVFDCQATITNNPFLGNGVTGSGGAISCQSGAVVSVTLNSFANNSATEGGGALHVDASTLTVEDCEIGPGNDQEINTAGWGGGIACLNDADVQITNTRIIGNGGSNCQAGGGIYATDSTLVVTDNEIGPFNSAPLGDGGGILCADTAITLTDNPITGNQALQGGGVSFTVCTGAFSDNQVSANQASGGKGGGLHLVDTQIPISNNQFINNLAVNGGGACVEYAPEEPTVFLVSYEDNFFDGNYATENGGGIYFDLSFRFVPQVERNTFSNNEAGEYGGALVLMGTCKPKVTNALIHDNQARWGGGIAGLDTSIPKFWGCVLYGNSAQDQGGGIFNASLHANPALLSNDIMWQNSAPVGPQVFTQGESVSEITYCDVQGGHEGEGNIDADPAFLNEANRNFHLTRFSPCINMGGGDDTGELPEDMDGTSRPYLGLYDMGADEFIDLHLLESVEQTLSLQSGGTVVFLLDAGVNMAGRQYLLLGSADARAPGIPLPGSATLPLNWDFFTDVIFNRLNSGTFQNFLGVLDASGRAAARLQVTGPLPGGFANETLYFAFLLDFPFNRVSNPLSIRVVN